VQPAQKDLTGIGLRSAHYKALLDEQPAIGWPEIGWPEIGWLEIHPENYFCGGVHTHYLGKARERYPVSFHAVGLSLGSSEPVSRNHLQKLKALADRFEPVRISDHASWSASGNAHFNDLLPLPYNQESIETLCRNITITQETLGRTILLENPSTYLGFSESTMGEPEFLVEIARRSGCGLLLDINNIYVQAHNHGSNAYDYLNSIPRGLVEEIHLAGHMQRQFSHGTLLIDTHNQPVCDGVWDLYRAALHRFGGVPTLIEWDKDIPALDVLAGEAKKAETILIQEQHYEAA